MFSFVVGGYLLWEHFIADSDEFRMNRGGNLGCILGKGQHSGGMRGPILCARACNVHAARLNAKRSSRMLGHATISQTMDTYSHVMPGMSDVAAEAIESALS